MQRTKLVARNHSCCYPRTFVCSIFVFFVVAISEQPHNKTHTSFRMVFFMRAWMWAVWRIGETIQANIHNFGVIAGAYKRTNRAKTGGIFVFIVHTLCSCLQYKKKPFDECVQDFRIIFTSLSVVNYVLTSYLVWDRCERKTTHDSCHQVIVRSWSSSKQIASNRFHYWKCYQRSCCRTTPKSIACRTRIISL